MTTLCGLRQAGEQEIQGHEAMKASFSNPSIAGERDLGLNTKQLGKGSS